MVSPEQYERWHNFALRMARACFKQNRNPNSKEIEANVERFFECLDSDALLSIVDWDNSDGDFLSVTDMCREHEDGWNPYYWSDEYGTATQQRHYQQFICPVICCIRAGLDMAVSPSAGVMGFTAGDLRAMYPEGVPDWITGGEGHRWFYGFDGEQKGTFAEMPDDAALLL